MRNSLHTFLIIGIAALLAAAGAQPASALQRALQFSSGSSQYVTFGPGNGVNSPPHDTLGVKTYTLECWFKRTGGGATTTTGSSMPAAVPLVSKGRGEADNSNVDCNYFLGIFTFATGQYRLFADYEEGAGQSSAGANRPITGVTNITDNVWHHAAVTLGVEGGNMRYRLYLDGAIEKDTLLTGTNHLPRWDSIQHAGIATAMTANGTPAGYFTGLIDEVRIWDHPRTGIADSMGIEIPAAPGLIGRWGLDEGSGTLASNSAEAHDNGVLVNTPVWSADSPFYVPTPPAAPSNLVATAPYWHRVVLTWTDNAVDETSYEVQRSTTGVGGTYSALATLGVGVTTYTDEPVDASAEYCYRVRAVNGVGPSAWADPACVTTPLLTCGALDLGGTNAYVKLGNPASLRLSQFTLEMWIRRDGAGVYANSGTGGLDLVPLITKGRGEAEDPARDINYFFGIRANSTNNDVLGADFEQLGGDTASLNHSVEGITKVTTGVWHHVAATYDGQTWRLYLDGILDREFTLAKAYVPASACTVSVALGTALNSGASPVGYFDGVMDEVRVWNVARSLTEIRSTINSQLTTAQPGLVGRWALDEQTGATVYASAGTTANGTILGANYTRSSSCAPFDWAPPPPPAAPGSLTAVASSSVGVRLTWSDDSTNETGFEIERSTTGSGGPFSPLASVGANVVVYDDGTVSPFTEYCYRVRAVNTSGASDYATPACATTPAFDNRALDLTDSTYVTFGDPAELDLSQFTIECWFKRDGIGKGNTTGASGIADAVPLVAHGAPEQDGSNVDMNFMLGFTSGAGLLCADFEEGAGGTTPGLNHPVTGHTPVGTAWHHAAATYDGTTWKLYLDGILEAANDIAQPVRSNTIQRASLGTMLTSSGVPNGYFDGRMDEVRIWNYARSQGELRSTANLQITTAQPGLVARWALDEASGTAVAGSAGTAIAGTIVRTGYTHPISDAGFDLTFNEPPLVPVVVAPPDDATGIGSSPSLEVQVSDPEGAPLTVTYYGRALNSGAGPDFTIAVLPDAQYYTAQTSGGSIATLDAQNNWVVANRVSRNIVYAVQLGDCTDTNTLAEWGRASTSFGLLENPGTTGLPQGIPFGVSVGNHDQTPNGDPTGTANYNATFGESRFSGRTYYGGHYGTDNDNWYETFSASGMDFIVISLEYDASMSASSASLLWADAVLTANPGRRAIVVSHFIINTGNPGGFGPQGQTVYNALKSHSNLFLMLCGHVPGEGRRQDAVNGTTVHTLLSDYQSRSNGGNGWMRLLEFSPANDVIRVRTYSPTLNQYEADADSSSQFTLAYPMTSAPAFQALGTTTVPSGSLASLTWPGLSIDTPYEWYVRVSDGTSTTTSPVWGFTTQGTASYTLDVTVTPAGGGLVVKSPDQPSYTAGTPVQLTAVPAPGYAFSGWSGGLTGTTNPATVTVTGNTAVTATFVPTTLNLVSALSPPERVTTVRPTVTVPVRVSRAVATAVLGFSVDLTVSSELTSSASGIHDGTFLASVNPSTRLQVVSHGSGRYTVDGVILGPPCGATQLDGLLFTVDVGGAVAAGTGTVTIDSVRFRDCMNEPLPAAKGAAATVTIDRTLPAVAVTAPNGGEHWPAGSVHPVTWTASDASGIASDGIDLAYSTDDGASWTDIATALANTGTHDWTVPATLSVTARVRVTARDAFGNPAADVSDAVFAIQGATTLALTVTPDPGVYQETETLTATVTPAAAGGTVEFLEGATSLGTAPLAGGVAVLELTTLAVGTHTLHAVYGGDALYTGSVSSDVTREVKARIVASAGPHGSVAPDGTTLHSLGATPSFTFTADGGYHVATVHVDGTPVPLTSPYTFAPVDANHTLAVTFDVNPPVAAVTTLAAAQLPIDSDQDGTIRLQLTWSDVVPGGATVEVYRTRFGGYPEYDGAGGSEPATPLYPPPSPQWELTGVTAAGQTDEVQNGPSGYAGRDSWTYVAFVRDVYGTHSVASNLTIGRPNYLLGDVADGTPGGLGRGNNVVDNADISALGSAYGWYGGAVAPVAYLDVGPTQDYSVETRPSTDRVIDFEDLVVFALNFNRGSVAPALASRSASRAALKSAADRLIVDAPPGVTAGQEFVVRLGLEGTGRVQALSAALGWDASVATLLGVEGGTWLGQLGGVAFTPAPGVVDVALLGVRESGFEGSGEVAVVRFRAQTSGSPGITVTGLKARDAANQPVGMSSAVLDVRPVTPSESGLSAAYPNPFRGSTTMDLSISEAGPVTVTVFGVDGRAVRALAAGRWEAGVHRVEWNGRDDTGRELPAGVYFVRMTTPKGGWVRKLAMLP